MVYYICKVRDNLIESEVFDMKYITTKVRFEEMEKALARVFKKMDKIGASYTFEKLNEFVRNVPVYNVDHYEKIKCVRPAEFVRVECVEFELDFDTYIVGDYRVGAVVERVDGNENIVYALDEAVDFNDYVHAELRCDHCNRKHRRNKTVVLIDNNTGDQVMVGKGCLKEFVGIGVEDFAKYIEDVQEYINEFEDGPVLCGGWAYRACIEPKTYLAACIEIIADRGYYKELKYDAIDWMKKNTPAEKNLAEATEVIKYFENLDPTDDFDNNAKIYLTEKKATTRANGYIAYAYIRYCKLVEREIEIAKRAEDRKKSQHVGNVGDKITVTGKPSVVTSWQTQWGYTTIYKIVDADCNVFIWKTSGDLIAQDEDGYDVYTPDMEEVTVKATIKEHNEYNGEKQTVITRCKVIGFKKFEPEKTETAESNAEDVTNCFDSIAELMNVWDA